MNERGREAGEGKGRKEGEEAGDCDKMTQLIEEGMPGEQKREEEDTASGGI